MPVPEESQELNVSCLEELKPIDMKKLIIIFVAAIIILGTHTAFKSGTPVNKAELGKLLFFDPILSKTNKISCSSCHLPEYAFADTSSVSKGVKGLKGTRNTPSAMNLVLQRAFFWDGRAKTLEDQALAPIENPVEMNLPIEKAVARLRNSKMYMKYFKAVFNSEPTRTNLADALSAFERTLETSDSPFDEWKFADNPNAVSESAKRGFTLFNGKAKCIQCHFGPNLNSNEFRNIGLFNGKDLNDTGRAVVTGKPEDIGRFKIGPLRNIAVTAPYMHNGMFKTLKEVIAFYDDPGKIVPGAINRDSLLAKPFGLTQQEKDDLEEFLISLTDKQFSGKKSIVNSQ